MSAVNTMVTQELSTFVQGLSKAPRKYAGTRGAEKREYQFQIERLQITRQALCGKDLGI